VTGVLLGTAVVAGTVIASGVWLTLAGSLPPTRGVLHVAGLSAPVRIERDGRGVPTLYAACRVDLAFATGFVHAQDRFFQMDLLRRHPAGELAELFGPALIHEDARMRVHRFRARARVALARASAQERTLLAAYARGVEAGRGTLAQSPWEYLVLGVPPAPWQEEDTLLVALGMYRMLQAGSINRERAHGLLHELLPPALAEFLSPPGTPWDAPLIGPALRAHPVPGPELVDLRHEPARWAAAPFPPAGERGRPGSNNWAVAGKRTTHGGALLANDMHLGLMVPNIWYRAAFAWEEDGAKHRAFGVTLPGAPALVVGSNTHVAWGFTNLEGDFADLVVLDDVPGKPDCYQTPAGPRAVERHEETIHISGAPSQVVVVEETVWGPVVGRDHRGQRQALRWVAHDPDAVNLRIMQLEKARKLEDALVAANGAGTPGQNLMVADARGRIAWTVLGLLPRRVGFSGRRPVSWADGTRRWAGWLPAADYPRVIDPPAGILWTANNRTVGEPYLSRLGFGCYDHGARAMQIRDGLWPRPRMSEADMLAVQLDDRALFLARWQRLLVEVLAPAAVADHPRRQLLRQEVISWGARAAAESVGFRAVRRFRAAVRDIILASLTGPCWRADRRFHHGHLDAGVEESVWLLVTQRPAHLLPPGHSSWDALLLAAVDRVIGDVERGAESFQDGLRAWTWGAVNAPRIRHPLSAALGPGGRWLRLDMPADPLPGDIGGMPRVQTPADGASQRMAVSPGREASGYFHMPTGQSGHPLSPHYRDGHADWAQGRAAPFLPGAATAVLELRP
jgi:penicillin amidase